MMEFWQQVLDGLRQDFSDLSDFPHGVRMAVRLIVAVLLGGMLGYQREHTGKAAGLRTHMLVSLGAALFVLFPEQAGMTTADLSRVIQGVATGIGFLGAGTILKRTDEVHIHGLTT